MISSVRRSDPCVLRKEVSKAWDLVEPRNAPAASILLLADQSAQENGLSASDRNRASHAALRDSRSESVGG